MNRNQEDEIVRTNLATRLLLMKGDICMMLQSRNDAVLGYQRAPLWLDEPDIRTLSAARKRVDELMSVVREPATDVKKLSVSEICACQKHLDQFRAAGIHKLYCLMEADLLQIKHLLTEAEKSGAKRQYHLHALLRSSLRKRI